MYDPVFDATFTLRSREKLNHRWWGGQPVSTVLSFISSSRCLSFSPSVDHQLLIMSWGFFLFLLLIWWLITLAYGFDDQWVFFLIHLLGHRRPTKAEGLFTFLLKPTRVEMAELRYNKTKSVRLYHPLNKVRCWYVINKSWVKMHCKHNKAFSSVLLQKSFKIVDNHYQP